MGKNDDHPLEMGIPTPKRFHIPNTWNMWEPVGHDVGENCLNKTSSKSFPILVGGPYAVKW